MHYLCNYIILWGGVIVLYMGVTILGEGMGIVYMGLGYCTQRGCVCFTFGGL